MSKAKVDVKPEWLEELEGGLDVVPGVECAATHCGTKPEGLDLALFRCEKPSVVAGTFTTNKFRAAPVRVSEGRVKGGSAQAIIVNSGNANCCTGERGLQDALAMGKRAAERLGLPEEEVLVCSTGKIGIYLPLPEVLAGIDWVATNLGKNSDKAAEAILTTDTRKKIVAVRFNHEGKFFTIAGIAKGAGMICPNMATMLSFLFTDASVEQAFLASALREAVEVSFNSITVDGDTSTNDTVLVLANGLAGPVKEEGKFCSLFAEALRYACVRLAKMIPADGEGATKLVEVRVLGAPSPLEAKRAALTVANSTLMKTALFAHQSNWGRIAAALGRSGVEGYDPSKVKVFMNGHLVLAGGGSSEVDQVSLDESMKKPEITVEMDLGAGTGSWQIWTCDLSYEYIRVNVDIP